MRVCKLLLLALSATLLPWLAARAARDAQQPGPAGKVDFVRDVQPLLRHACVGCHGATKQMAGLQLDNKKIAARVITPGNSSDSRIVHRLLGLHGEARMPLSGEPLGAEKIALIKRWIDEGAVWPDSASSETVATQHWAFVAPVRPALPVVKNPAWARTPIDRFILAKIEETGLTPSPEANKTTLIRRLSLDLIGLPPTPAEIDRFVNDESAHAYEQLVERLLASPHYGERWGRWWLDAARYADSNGFEKDEPRSIWPYRDWVIKAFNDDQPFDRFTIEQLAGDLLAKPTRAQIIATGFLRNSMLNEEGAVDPEQFRVEQIVDRVDAVGKAFLGLTINCAQCHTHKFDPIRHEEFYRFYAFLNNDSENELEVTSAEEEQKRAEIARRIAAIEDELIAKDAGMPKRMAEWEARAKRDVGNWTVLDDLTVTSSFGVKFENYDDHSFVPRGSAGPPAIFTIKAKTKLTNITGLRLELLTDATLPYGGPGRSPDGGFVLSEFTATAAPLAKPEAAQRIAIANATADFSAPDAPIKNTIDDNPKTHWTIDAGPGRRNQDRKAVFAAQAPFGFDSGTLLTIRLAQNQSDRMIGRFRLSVTTDVDPHADPLPANVRRILAVPAAERTKAEQHAVFSFYRTQVGSIALRRNDGEKTLPAEAGTTNLYAAANQQIDTLMKTWPEQTATTLVLGARQWPRPTHIFRRGDWKRPGEQVQPGTPSFLHPLPAGAPPNRLGLAQWIIDRRNPLTARVIVNRIWQNYFGAGLVATPEDFGTRCARPSHPELLDWLAVEFMEKGWKLKDVHRLIVNSATYRQSSRLTPKLQEADPTNVLLARAPRLRVEAETIRDIALAASGLLNPQLGGPSVFPPIPDGVMSLGFGTVPLKWETSMGAARYRRALYTFWRRSVPYPSMAIFDAPAADAACTRRLRSNTPLQALTTLNDQIFMEAAQALALRVWRAGGARDDARLAYAFRLATGRAPDEFEQARFLTFLRKQRAQFARRTAAAVYVSAADLNKLPEEIDLHELAPWTLVARALLNLDETITKQ